MYRTVCVGWVYPEWYSGVYTPWWVGSTYPGWYPPPTIPGWYPPPTIPRVVPSSHHTQGGVYALLHTQGGVYAPTYPGWCTVLHTRVCTAHVPGCVPLMYPEVCSLLMYPGVCSLLMYPGCASLSCTRSVHPFHVPGWV